MKKKLGTVEKFKPNMFIQKKRTTVAFNNDKNERLIVVSFTSLSYRKVATRTKIFAIKKRTNFYAVNAYM